MKLLSYQKDSLFLQQTISDLTEEIGLLTMLQDISKQLISKFDLKQILDMFLDLVKEIINYHACILYLYQEDAGTYRIVESRGLSGRELENYELDDDVVKWVLEEGRWTHTSFLKDPTPESKDFVTILPLQGIKKSPGFLLTFSDPKQNIFTPANVKLLSFVASQAGIALENQELYSELCRSKDYIQNILENINNGIITIDMGDKITHINKNATAMLALPSADVIGADFKEVLNSALVEMIDKEKKRAIRDGFTFEALFEYFPSENFSIPLGINSSLLLDDNGHRIGIIIVLRNMSASKELERLRQLDEMKSEFVSNVSHELRTPLSIIKSYVEALLDQVAPDDHQTQKDFLTVVNSETDRLTDLVSDLLDISRIESGRFEIEPSPVALSEVIQSVLAKLADLGETHELVVDIPPSLPNFMADTDKMFQVFLNLITNAIKFSPNGGEIRIQAEVYSNMLRCLVSDQGIGIPREDLDRVFEKFYRVDNSDNYEIPGTGLGLPIVKHIIDSHAGEISVNSELGKGSTFTLLLPLEND